MIFGGFLFTCSSDDDTPNDTVQVNGVSIVDPASFDMVIDETIQLTAIVTPASAPQSVSWSSSDTNVLAVNSSGQVTAISEGNATITATSTADSTKSASIQLTVTECPTPRDVPRTISSDLTLENWIANRTCIDYVAGQTSISNSIITIEPGVRLAFEEGRSMVFRGSTVAINAVGTETDPIIFTGLEQQRGNWGALLLDGTDNPANRLEHIELEYGGVANVSGSVFQAGLILMGNTITTLRNVTVRESASYGLAMMNSATLTTYGNNTFTQNTSGPAHVYASRVHFLDATSSGDGNDVDFVMVYPTTITEEVNWVPFGERYIIEQRNDRYAFDVRGSSAFLTLAPGVILWFEEDMALTIADNGGIAALGTASSRVVISGFVPSRGYWRGVRIQSDHPNNRFDNVTLEYGGGNTHSGSVQPANVWVDNGANIKITNSELSDSDGYGLVAEGDAILPDFNGNTLNGNVLAAAHVRANVAEYLTDSSTYTGNGQDIVHVLGYTNRLNEPTVWEDLGVPYVVYGQEGLYVDDVSFTIEEGTEILFQGNIGLAIIGGTLNVEGTQDNPVLLGGYNGFWKGILLQRSTANFEYTSIEQAGSSSWNQFPAGAVSIMTLGGAASSAAFGSGTSHTSTSGDGFGVVFGYGNTTANCGPMEPASIPTGDSIGDHCQ